MRFCSCRPKEQSEEQGAWRWFMFIAIDSAAVLLLLVIPVVAAACMLSCSAFR
jgi:hypothetical protein